MKHHYVVIGLVFLSLSMLILGVFFVSNPRTSFSLSTENKDGLLPEITNCTAIKNITYSSEPSPYHAMDAYIPVGEGPFPVIIYIHGGGWTGGSRSNYNDIATFYAKRGIAGFAIDYTLTKGNDTAWPENIQDVIEAIRFIKGNAELYRIDSQRIAVLGNSAGAQLASLAGTLTGNEPFLAGSSGNEKIRSQFCLVIDYAGATDFEYVGQNLNRSLINWITKVALGNTSYRVNPALWREASPATYISSDDPIFCLIHGTNDTVVPIEVAESFNAKLQAKGVPTVFIKVPDGDHDILTSKKENLIVRYTLDPLLAMVFTAPTPPNYPAWASFAMSAVFGLAAALVFRAKFHIRLHIRPRHKPNGTV